MRKEKAKQEETDEESSKACLFTLFYLISKILVIGKLTVLDSLSRSVLLKAHLKFACKKVASIRFAIGIYNILYKTW